MEKLNIIKKLIDSQYLNPSVSNYFDNDKLIHEYVSSYNDKYLKIYSKNCPLNILELAGIS